MNLYVINCQNCTCLTNDEPITITSDNYLLVTILILDTMLLTMMAMYFGLSEFINYIFTNWWIYLIFSIQVIFLIIINADHIKVLSQIFILWSPYLYQLRSATKNKQLINYIREIQVDNINKFETVYRRLDLMKDLLINSLEEKTLDEYKISSTGSGQTIIRTSDEVRFEEYRRLNLIREELLSGDPSELRKFEDKNKEELSKTLVLYKSLMNVGAYYMEEEEKIIELRNDNLLRSQWPLYYLFINPDLCCLRSTKPMFKNLKIISSMLLIIPIYLLILSLVLYNIFNYLVS
jgi:hypothetical protein